MKSLLLYIATSFEIMVKKRKNTLGKVSAFFAYLLLFPLLLIAYVFVGRSKKRRSMDEAVSEFIYPLF